MINVIVSGIVTGFLYAMAGLGLVAVYRTTRVINFALGGMGAISAYIASTLLNDNLAYGYVFPIALIIGGIVGLLVEFGVVRPLRRLPPLTIAIGTLAVLLILQGILGAEYGYSPQALPEVLANAGTLRAGSFAISANQILIIGVGIVVTALLIVLMLRTRLGLTMRATSSGPQTCSLLGVNVSRTRVSAWVIGGAYGALAALLVTPQTYLAPSSFTTFLLTAFAAVVLGGFASIPGVVIGSLFFGVAINLLEVYLNSKLIDVYTFIGIALVLVFRPHGLFGKREHEVSEPDLSASGGGVDLGEARPRAPEAPSEDIPAGETTAKTAGQIAATETTADEAVEARPRRWWAVPLRYTPWLGVLLVFAIVPLIFGQADVFLLATALAAFVGILGLNILVGYSGQVSLAHSAFLLIGALTSAIAISHGVAPLVTLPIALAVGAVVGLLIGLPATRLSGLYLVLLTLTFAFAIPELDLQFGSLTGGSNGLPINFPTSLTDPSNQYWFVLAIAAFLTVVTLIVVNTRLGRGWRAARDSPDGAQALGLRPFIIKIGAFAWSAAFAALGGALTSMLVGFVTPGSYDVFISIYALLAIVLGGTGSIFGSLLGAMFITLVPNYTQGSGVPQDVIFGAVLLAVLIVAPSGIVGLLQRVRDQVQARVRRGGGLRSLCPPHLTRARSETGAAGSGRHEPAIATADHLADVVSRAGTSRTDGAPPPTSTTTAGGSSPTNGGAPLLAVNDLSAGYGLVDVLHEVSLQVGHGEVVALVGANGVGKSTLLRTISGLIAPSSGAISWRGQKLSGRTGAHRITRMGIGHVPEGRAIFPDLSVSDNLTMGTFGIGDRVGGHGMSRDDVLQRFPIIKERAKQRAGTLSGGQQQMLAIGRALVGRPELLMLDEPSLGLAPVIVDQVFDILREIASSGVSVLLVEQNAQAALALADRAYVISRGRIVLQGTAEELRSDERLRETYLAVGAA